MIKLEENPFNLDHCYKFYLQTVKLKESEMSAIQRQETKRAFIGACGVILVVLKKDLSELKEDDAIKMLQSMFDQVTEFYMKETNRQN